MLASIYALPFVGDLADYLPKRTLIFASNLLLATMALGLAAVMRAPESSLVIPFSILLVSGAISAVAVVTQQAMMREVVSQEQLVQANALVAPIQSAPMVIEPALCTWLYSMGGFSFTALLNAARLALAALAALVCAYHSCATP